MFKDEIICNDWEEHEIDKYKKENWYNIYYDELDFYFWSPESKIYS